MRMLLKVSIPVEAGNAAVRSGTLGATIQKILDEVKPEAAYFSEHGGVRTGYIIFDMQKSSQLPALAEPWFLAFNAKVELHPTMTMEDLKNSAPGMESAVKKYSKSVHPVGR